MHITPETAKELYGLGFSYRHYQRRPHMGMAYYCDGSETVLGGTDNGNGGSFTEEQKRIISEGIWLPSGMHLAEWLWDNGFTYAIVNCDGFYDVTCRDSVTGTEYRSKTPTLEVSVASVVKKILKKREREFDVNEKIFGEIES